MILVTGATGNVGREVVNVLLDDGQEVAAVTRNPAAAELLALAVEQDVERVVALSAVTVQYAAGYRRFADAFKALEDAIKASGPKCTFLRSADYAANTVAWAPQMRSASVVRSAYGDAATSTIHERDVAAITARVLVNSAYDGHSYVLTGPQSLTQRDKGRLIGEAIGKELSFEELPPSNSATPCSPRAFRRTSPTGCSAPWPTTPSSRDRRRAPWSRFSAAPHSPSPNGQPSTPPPSGTDGNAMAIMSVSQQETID